MWNSSLYESARIVASKSACVGASTSCDIASPTSTSEFSTLHMPLFRFVQCVSVGAIVSVYAEST
jgi:hypothetical protein